MTENEIKILLFLLQHDYYNTNITDIVLKHDLNINEDDFQTAISSLYKKELVIINLKNGTVKCYETTNLGKDEATKIRTQIDLQKDRETKDAINQNAKSTKQLGWVTLAITLLGVVAVIFQCVYAKEANEIQQQLMHQQEKNIESSKTILQNPVPQNIYITISKDGKMKTDTIKTN